MMRARSMLWVYSAVLMLLLAALGCNLPVGVPRATPTLAPSLTPSQTPVATSTETSTATQTLTATATPTTTSSPTATHTATATASNTPTATATGTPLPTNTWTPSPTHAVTLEPSTTPTASLTALPTASATETPSSTPRPIAQLVTATQVPTAFQIVTATPLVITVVRETIPTSTLIPVTATLNPTEVPVFTVTPLPAPDLSANDVPTAPPVTAIALAPVDTLNPLVAAQNAYILNAGTLQLSRPAEESTSVVYAARNAGGSLALIEYEDIEHPGMGYALRVGEVPLVGSPLPSETIRFSAVKWSPAGNVVAFIAETPGALVGNGLPDDMIQSDGLWVWSLDANTEVQFTHSALRNRYASEFGSDEARILTDFAWSPDGLAMIAMMDREGGFPGEVWLLPPDWDANNRPPVLRHEFGSWSLDGRFIVVSGVQTDIGSLLGRVERETQSLEVLLDGRTLASPLYIAHAADLADGRYAFLGTPYTPDSPNDVPVSADIGLYVVTPGSDPVLVTQINGGPVLSAAWNASHSAVLLKLTDERTLVVNTSGSITDLTGQVGVSAVTWGN